jgi:dTDP-4-dehydrorhamnose 3,5-epimerase
MWQNFGPILRMKIIPTELSGIVLIEPESHRDERGLFYEAFNRNDYLKAGLDLSFVQDNVSHSGAGVLRGLHYQLKRPQGKLVTVLRGRIFDVAVDLRRHSKTFGQWVSADLSGYNHRVLWVPPGFAHGFYVLSQGATVLYKVTEHYAPDQARTLLWNDPALRIEWPLKDEQLLILSDQDRAGLPLEACQVYEGQQWL